MFWEGFFFSFFWAFFYFFGGAGPAICRVWVSQWPTHVWQMAKWLGHLAADCQVGNRSWQFAGKWPGRWESETDSGGCPDLGPKHVGEEVSTWSPRPPRQICWPHHPCLINTSKMVHIKDHPLMTIPWESHPLWTQWQRNQPIGVHFLNFKSQKIWFISHVLKSCYYLQIVLICI